MKKLIDNFIKDVKLELDDEFDMNFERKSFFNEPWKDTKHTNPRGSLMMRTGMLRKSISSKISGDSIRYSSSVPYASIHNEGGTITVTRQMKKFFWAMYYKTGGAVSGSGSQRDRVMSAEQKKWKAMALMPVGKQMKIEQRQFIGDHAMVRKSIEDVFRQDTIPEMKKYFETKFKQK